MTVSLFVFFLIPFICLDRNWGVARATELKENSANNLRSKTEKLAENSSAVAKENPRLDIKPFSFNPLSARRQDTTKVEILEAPLQLLSQQNRSLSIMSRSSPSFGMR